MIFLSAKVCFGAVRAQSRSTVGTTTTDNDDDKKTQTNNNNDNDNNNNDDDEPVALLSWPR